MKDVLLLNPPTRRPGMLMEHLGLGYLAAMLRQYGFSAEIIDAPADGLDFDELTNELKKQEFLMLGVSILFQENLRPTMDWLQGLKESGLKTHLTIGAHPATFTYREILTDYDCVNSIALGEGEHTITELAEKIKYGNDWRSVDGIAYRDGSDVIVNPSRPLIKDLDCLPWPARDISTRHPRAYDQLVASASRGCHRYCSFCSIATFYRSFKGRVWRSRNPEDVFDEIDAARKITPYDHVLLVDDTFIGPGKKGREKAFEFAESLGRRRNGYLLGSSCRADQVDYELFKELKKAGLGFVFLGIESGNRETLNLYHKDSTVDINTKALAILEKLNIPVEIGFIMFNPYTTFSQIKSDLDFLLRTRCGPDIRHLSSLGLFPGQPILDKIQSDGLLKGSPFEYNYKFLNKAVGKFFDSIREDLLNDQKIFMALRKLGQIVQADKFGEITLAREERKEAEDLVYKFHVAFYDLLSEAANMFSGDKFNRETSAKLRNNFSNTCERLTEKTMSIIGQERSMIA